MAAIASTSAVTLDDEDFAYAEELVATLERLRAAPASDGDLDAANDHSSKGGRPRQEILKELGWISAVDEEGAEGRTFSKEHVRQLVVDRFLTPKWTLEDPYLGLFQLHWKREPDYRSLLWAQPTARSTKLEFTRAGLEGRIVGYNEIVQTAPTTATAAAGLSAKDSTSLSRAPTAKANFVRGKSGNFMFAPGGLEDEVLKDDEELAQTLGAGAGVNGVPGEDRADGDAAAKTVENMEAILSSKAQGLRTVPPGFSRGFFEKADEEEDLVESQEDFAKGLKPEPVYVPVESSHVSAIPSRGVVNGHANAQDNIRKERVRLDAELDELLPTERPQPLPNRRAAKLGAKRDWAHVVDVRQTLANFHELVPEMAHSFPFELDNFQKEAVYHLEQGDSVFVAAHTSAGKTVVAEYAIGLAMKHMTRCIYTSPIKALSNQKFRDFKKTFGAENVGILTGDVQINPEAPCLIMTTEILRSMLYRGADLIRDVEFVIFDEVHYVNDQERGVVWEEVIILCPQHINLILLSATVPNTKEFADWVGRTKKKNIYVISTPKRPVPLEHFLYAGKDLFKIVDAKGQLLTAGIKDANEANRRRQDKEREAAGLPPPVRGGARGARGGQGRGGGQRGGAPAPRGGGAGGGGALAWRGPDKNLWIHLVGMLRKKDLLPVVVFVFSKKRCEENASSMPNTDLCTAREKSEVHIIIEKSLSRLKEADRRLPQIIRMRDLLKRGIGVHHGGLLPIVKEVVEILFQRGLVKVLFATETFAMGVNMPARSVVFSGIRKHDGHGFRDLLAGEYTQMSGRAGRRGLDATGVVIINASEKVPESSTLNTMLLGQPTKLSSQFRLTYNMILNLLRVEALKVEDMIKRSFSENASQKLLPDQEKKMKELEKRLTNLPYIPDKERAEKLSLYYDLCAGAFSTNQAIYQMALEQQQGSKNFCQGRVVVLRDTHFEWNGAIIIKQVAPTEFLVLAAVTKDRKAGQFNKPAGSVAPLWPPRLSSDTDDLVYDLCEVPLSSIQLVTPHVQKVELSLILAHRISAMQGAVTELVPVLVHMHEQEHLPEVDWSRLRRLDFQEALRARDGYTARVDSMDVVSSEGFDADYRITHQQKVLEQQVAEVRMSLSDENLELLPDYHQRIQVLKTLRFIDPINESVLLKGRVACEINSVNELVLTELILNNTFATYTPEEVVALLSPFVFQEKSESVPELNERLSEGYAQVLATAERVGTVQAANKLNFEDYAVTLKTHLIEVVYEWARGMPFEKITDLTDVQEGTIVRVITRLDETCREVRDAARVIGDADLFRKMEECQSLIRRDIVFAASLYF